MLEVEEQFPGLVRAYNDIEEKLRLDTRDGNYQKRGFVPIVKRRAIVEHIPRNVHEFIVAVKTVFPKLAWHAFNEGGYMHLGNYDIFKTQVNDQLVTISINTLSEDITRPHFHLQYYLSNLDQTNGGGIAILDAMTTAPKINLAVREDYAEDSEYNRYQITGFADPNLSIGARLTIRDVLHSLIGSKRSKSKAA
jgi:hypothetical protein